MAIQFDFAALQRAADQMGTYDIDFEVLLQTDYQQVSIDLSQGCEVDSDEVDVTPGGLLSVFGQQAVLYIPDQGRYLADVLADGIDACQGRRFHLADCSTIRLMKDRQRYERYVARNGLSPVFSLSGILEGYPVVHAEGRLAVCHNCLKKLNYQNYRHLDRSHQRQLIAEFSLGEFFARYASYFRHKPAALETLITAVEGDSVLPGSELTVDQKRQARCDASWCCGECGVCLKQRKHLLEVCRSKDGDVNEVRVLCQDCLSKQKRQQGFFVWLADRMFIQQQRRAQGLYPQTMSADVDQQTARECGWQRAYQQADPALHDLMALLEGKGWPVPQVASSVSKRTGQVFYPEAPLCWPDKKLIVDFFVKPGTRLPRGWRSLNVSEALSAN